ncbi:MAG: Xylose isomerase domain protein barrel [Verrucomicrobiales bacterium]|nr:Xylose isomerase domain protein barrel [Verrucomicrobiales bacterium]
MKFAICNEIFADWHLQDAMGFARKLGYQGIEIAPYTIAPSVNQVSAAERAELRKAAERIGIEICGIHWVLIGVEGMYLNHPNTPVQNRTRQYLRDLVDFCADIGGKIMVVGSPKQRMVMQEVSSARAWAIATDTFRDAVKTAEDRGVTICIEPLAPTETNFINTAYEAVEFARQFNSPAMKVILDVKAMCSEELSIPKIITESTPHFAHFHANDKNLKGPGFGKVDFHPIATALKQSGYNGFVSVEVFKFDEGPEVIATKSLQYLREVFELNKSQDAAT